MKITFRKITDQPEPLQRGFLLDEKSVTWDVQDQGRGKSRSLISHGRVWGCNVTVTSQKTQLNAKWQGRLGNCGAAEPKLKEKVLLSELER